LNGLEIQKEAVIQRRNYFNEKESDEGGANEDKDNVEMIGGGIQDQWIRKDLIDVKDIEFLGKIFIGSPKS
jgi:hypothetical protein